MSENEAEKHGKTRRSTLASLANTEGKATKRMRGNDTENELLSKRRKSWQEKGNAKPLLPASYKPRNRSRESVWELCRIFVSSRARL